MVKRILLAEDDADTSFIVRKMLTQAGYEVQCMAEGTQLVENRNDWPDLFILDKDLPAIDGVALCKFFKLKDATRNIPVIIISGHHHQKRKALKAGANAFIEKPFEQKKLLRAIAKCVKGLPSGLKEDELFLL